MVNKIETSRYQGSYDGVYHWYFQNEATEKKWEDFESKVFDGPLSLPDFSIQEKLREPTWKETSQKIAAWVIKIAFAAWVCYELAKRFDQRFPDQGHFVQLVIQNPVVTGLSHLREATASRLKHRWHETALKLATSSFVIYELARYVVQRLIMTALYPAQSRIAKNTFVSHCSTTATDKHRKETATKLKERGYVVRHVCLEKNGIRYSGLLIGHSETISNGKWALQATGNAEPVEKSARYLFATFYNEQGFNTLVINGPGVGRSKGQAVPVTMGDAQDVGLHFLETAIKAKEIVLAGRSLGGAAIGQAILQHDFKTDEIKYLAIRQMSFDRVSNIAAKILEIPIEIVQEAVKGVIRWAGVEIDSIAASRKLQELGITEVVVQGGYSNITGEILPKLEDFRTDGIIIDQAGLGYGLIRDGITENKVFYCIKIILKGETSEEDPDEVEHNTYLSILAAEKEIRALESKVLATAGRA